MSKVPRDLFNKLNNNRLLRRFLMVKLPLAFIAGVRMVNFTKASSTVSMRYRWINQNPFGSMYFAAMNMGAELACGLLVFAYINESGKKISMLLEEQHSEFKKKATGKVLFICQEGDEIANAVKIASESPESQKLDVKVYATDEVGTILATFVMKWSLKAVDRLTGVV